MASGSRMKTIDGKYYVTNDDVNKLLSGDVMSGIISGAVSGAISTQLSGIQEAGLQISGKVQNNTESINNLQDQDVIIHSRIDTTNNNVKQVSGALSWVTLT